MRKTEVKERVSKKARKSYTFYTVLAIVFNFPSLVRLIQFLKNHLLNAYGIVPFQDYDKRHLSRQIVLLITLSPFVLLLSLVLRVLKII